MVFSSPIFLFFFLPAVLLAHLVAGKRMRNFVLLLFSLLFYAWGEGKYLVLLFLSMGINYGSALLIERFQSHKKLLLGLSVGANLLLLGVFKYAGFAVDSLNNIVHLFGGTQLDVPLIRLPIGVSFFTFQAMSYVIDVYRKDVPVTKNIIDFTLYITLFPQLIAGPIVRYIDVYREIRTRSLSLESFSDGISRFIIGLSKKVIIANTMGQVADMIFSVPVAYLGFSTAWLAVVCYAFQIYFDFSGYSDMAIGLGKMFGFTFLENFNYPYISQSIREFWRRWHISLSTWFRDYLYIPLGGSRVRPMRAYMNMFIVFLLCGLWHGASWNFVIWGGYYGFFLVLERLKPVMYVLEKIGRPLRHVYTLLVVLFGWVFFRLTDIFDAWQFILRMVGVGTHDQTVSILQYANAKVLLVLVIAIIASLPVTGWFKKKWKHNNNKIFSSFVQTGYIVALMLLLFISSMLVAGDTYNPFIYFRF